MSSVAFSSDGSMVAVGCGTAVPLWSTKTAELVDVLESPFSETKGFHHLVFVPGTPFLAGKSLTPWLFSFDQSLPGL